MFLNILFFKYLYKVIEIKIIINVEIYFKCKESDLYFINFCLIEFKIFLLFYCGLWLWLSKKINILFKVERIWEINIEWCFIIERRYRKLYCIFYFFKLWVLFYVIGNLICIYLFLFIKYRIRCYGG